MPTIFNFGPYRFYFFSREEKRRHVHVSCPNGEVKFWLEPKIEVAKVINLQDSEVLKIQRIIEERQGEINECWERHFTL